MQNAGFSRRSFLRAMTGALGVSWLALDWSDVAAAAHGAHLAAAAPDASSMSFLTRAEAAVVEAVSAQVIPSDDTPGAREAGVVFFVDRALATFFSPIANDFRAQLSEFEVRCRARYPANRSFATLSSEQQIEYLGTVEHDAFFARMRLLTVLGMFAMPAYGGNRDGVGWKLLGFEDQHLFEPPFGYYDRDYPGFVLDPTKPT
jgi:gluconate 2-dehydrogenase gamma chain